MSALNTSGGIVSSTGAGLKNENNLFYQALHVSRPVTPDTSLVSTDNINNPRTMNAVYYLGPRMGLAKKWGKETIGGGGLKQSNNFNEYVLAPHPPPQFFSPPSTTWTPRVLKDGADSVGALGALNRVVHQHRVVQRGVAAPLSSGAGRRLPITPIPLEVAQRNSVYWRATELQTPQHGQVLSRHDRAALLEGCSPRGAGISKTTPACCQRGKVVFAERCARCHSSKTPPNLPAGLDLENANGPGYLHGMEPVLGVDQDGGVQEARCGRSCWRQLPQGQLPLHRVARAGHTV